MKKIFDILLYKYFPSFYRKIDECFLFEDSSKVGLFKSLPIIKFKWIADPFLFENDGKTYCFAEVASFFTGKGSIYVCCLNDNPITWKQIIKEKCHLSFPNVFRYGGSIYLMPESSGDYCVCLYRCISFPFEWTKLDEPLIVGKLVDTVFSPSLSLYSYSISEESYKLIMFEPIKLNNKLKERAHINDNDLSVRPAGQIFAHGGKWVFPTQICKNRYGEGPLLNYLSEGNDSFSLEPFAQLTTHYISKKIHPHSVGMHTYNKTEKYECIDVQYERFCISGLFLVMKGIFRKIFGKKK